MEHGTVREAKLRMWGKVEPMTSFPGILTTNGQARATESQSETNFTVFSGIAQGPEFFSCCISHTPFQPSRVPHQICDERNPIGRNHQPGASGISSVPR